MPVLVHAESSNTGVLDRTQTRLRSLHSYFSSNVGSTRKLYSRLFGLVAAWAVFFAVRLALPVTPGLPPAARATLAVVLWACILWVSEAVPSGVTGISIPFMLIFSQALKTPAQALSGFTQQAVFLALSAFMFAAVMQLSGLDRRLAMAMLHKLRVKTVTGATVSLFLTNCVMAFVIPGAVSRSATLLPVVKGMREFLGDTADAARAVKGLVIQGLVYAPMMSGLLLLTAGLPNLIIVTTVSKDTGVNISYGQWAALNWIYLLMFVPTLLWTSWLFKTKRARFPQLDRSGRVGNGSPQEAGAPTGPAERQPLTGPQIAALCVFVLMAAGWAFIHTIKPGIIGLFGVLLLTTPGLLPYSWKQILEHTMWNAFLLLGGALSMTLAMSSSGLGRYLANQAAPLAQGHGWLLVILIFMVLTEVLRLGMLSNVAAIALIAPILLPLGVRLGVNPIAFTLLVANIDTFAYVLPTQISAAVIAYGTDTFSIKDYAKSGSVSLVIAIVFSVVVVVPWYALMGFPIWSMHGIHLR